MTHELSCDQVREHLLDHLYGALVDADAAEVERHLAACDACRAATRAARAQRDVLAEAALAEAGDLRFDAPSPSPDPAAAAPRGHAPTASRVAERLRPRGPLVPKSWRIGLAAAAVAGVVLGAGDALLARSEARERFPVVAIEGPASVSRGVPAELRVSVHDTGGGPVAARLKAVLPARDGTFDVLGEAAPDADGVARLPIDTSKLAPGVAAQIEVRAEIPDASEALSARVAVRETTRLVTRVSTDKPLYRPGETLRVRGVALESLRLTPAGNADLRLKLLDPRGAVVTDVALPTLSGVTAWEHALPADAPGGTWRLALSGPDGAAIASSERAFRVRTYRTPRLRFDTELDRASYRPGESGTLWLKVLRAEGGVPAGATAESAVMIDGANVFTRDTYPVGADGGVTIPFTLPSAIEEGRATVSVTVRDGGTVETTAKTVPLVVDTLKFESFPEGGTLVAGLPNRVYFRARTPAGEPAELDAELRDASGARLAAIRSEVKGLGAFEFTPAAGETYRVVFASSGSPVGEGATLTASAAGATLRTLDDEVPASAPVRVRVGSPEGGRFSVTAWCRGVELGSATVDVPKGGTADASVRLRSEVGGAVRVTLFDPEGVPVAERLVARRPAQRLDVAVTTSRAKYAPRERVLARFRATDENGAASQAILGASVVDASVLSYADDRDTAPMAFHFLAGMEVEELEDASVFAEGKGAAAAVDRLLGVQGWRRFAWRDPAAFAKSHPDAGPRVAPVVAADVGTRWTNEREARRWVDHEVQASLRNSIGLAIFCSIVLLLVGGIALGARAAAQGRRVVAGFAFAGPVVVGLVGIVAVIVPTMQSGADFTASRGPELDDVQSDELTFGKYIDYGGGGGLGARLLDFLEEQTELAVDKALFPTAAEPAPSPGGKWEEKGLDAEDLAEEETAVVEGRQRVLEIEKLRALGYIGGPATPGSVPELDPMASDDDDERNGYAIALIDEKTKLRRAARLVREYAHRAMPFSGTRDDFAEVLAWAPLLVTDANGEAQLEFDTPDSITSFRVAVDAHDGRGALGAGEAEFTNRVPFFAEPKFPVALTSGDEVDLPVVVGNDGERPLVATVALALDGKLLARREGSVTQVVTVASGARERTLVPIVALAGRGAAALDLDVTAAGGLRDRSRRAVDVHPRGYPVRVDRSGVLERADTTTFVLPAHMDGASLRGSLRVYPSTLATLVDGLDAMLEEPHGCFEQVSSSNYPNVLVLNYLEQQRAAAPAVARRAKDLLAKGYAMLTGYECRDRGFEWFGKDPAHEGLTAYGVLEFVDMARVYPVDAALIARTRAWLLARRDGSGGFRRLANGHDGFAHAPQDVHDAYVAWSLSEADATSDLTPELGRMEQVARDSEEPYVLALAAGTLRNRSHAAAKRAVDRLAAMQRPDGGFDAKGTSITSSVGSNLETETAALAILAFAKSPDRIANGEAAVRFLLGRRRGGSFGATQATVLALRALTEHARVAARAASDHDVTVLVNGVEVARRAIAAGAPGVVEFRDEVLSALHPGENQIDIRTTGAGALPWAVALDFATTLPANDPECTIGIETTLAAATAREGDPVEAAVVVRNRADTPQAMTLARIGVPAGLEPRAERLEELKKSGAIDFFELRPREVVLYWRGLRAREERRVAIELTAAIPGRFEGPASSAYLYYGDDRKTWAAPLRCAIEAVR